MVIIVIGRVRVHIRISCVLLRPAFVQAQILLLDAAVSECGQDGSYRPICVFKLTVEP